MGVGTAAAHSAGKRSFLVLFFKKERFFLKIK
jgi:hypothetical protein